MSTPKVIRATQNLLRQVNNISHKLTKALVSWLLRGLLLLGRQPLASRAGFVLPTTVLLLLVVVLTVGAISYRTFTRTQQAITERQQQVIYNAATPVIDRAKSKIEFLFDPKKDTRGGGVPSQTQLLGMMLNDAKRDLGGGVTVPHFPLGDDSVDPYTFDGEERIDVNGDGQPDNAWRYRVDLDGDGNTNSPGSKDGVAVYSIIFTAPQNTTALQDSRNDAWKTRAQNLLIRNAPLSNANPNQICERNTGGGEGVPLINGDGWFPDPGSRTKIRKNFQVNAYVVPDNPNGTVATLEFQQDREATQGFKWAAWFRNDLEIYPGPAFNWNGAMHTEGNLIIGGDKFRGYLVSSRKSCINGADASEITVKVNDENQPVKGTPEFRGRFITGTLRDNDYKGKPKFDLPIGQNDVQQSVEMAEGKDSIAPGGRKPLDFALDPVALQTAGFSKPRDESIKKDQLEDAAWPNSDFNKNGQGRFRADDQVTTPYVDDTFRADNRWGPKPTWGPKSLPIGVTDEANAGAGSTAKIGDEIQGVPELTGSDPAPGTDSASVGLDGYWERRARIEGLRLIVGQRLELGDPAGWGGPGGASGSVGRISLDNEPLRPWSENCAVGTTCNEKRQRKAQWDNLAAVQATAVYHNATDSTAAERDFPDACLVTTVHPGTPSTLDRSATFENLAYGLPANAIPGYTDKTNPLIISDFFRGRGTNGWEFSVPKAADFSNKDSNLMKALRNLAYFAGDPNGGTPSFRPKQVAGQQVHPYPSMAMWGDFSMLRNVFKLLDGGVSYDALSPADKTTLHTAGCTMSMLAYNLDYLEKLKVFDPDPSLDPTRLKADGSPSVNPALQALTGYTNRDMLKVGTTPLTDDQINTNGVKVDATLLAKPEYSAGLRGRIRVIDHISKGYITAANYTTIPAENRPPLKFVDSIKDINKSSGIDFMVWNPKGSNNPEVYVRLMERWRDNLTTASPDKEQRDRLNQEIALAQLIITKEQVARDRTWGFTGTYGTETYGNGNEPFVSTFPLGDCGFKVDDTNKAPGWVTEATLKFQAVKADLTPDTSETEVKVDPLSRFCSARPRYPVLYSLFPAVMPNALTPPATVDAGYGGGFTGHKDISGGGDADTRSRDFQDNLIKFARYINTENAPAEYTVVRPSDIAAVPSRLSQSGVTLGGTTDWVLPYKAGTPGVGSTPNNNQYNLIKVCGTNLGQPRCSEPAAVATTFQQPRTGTLVRVAFKDGAFYNGREMLPVRTLDMDLDLMRSTSYKDDLWLPQKGIIYAYREDAVSESHIVRPNTGNSWDQCNTDAKLQTDACAMQTADRSAYESKDPPVNKSNFITPKPVDYYADPDRRPYGFRLRQGASLKRDDDEGRGLSLISDNPVFIQGNFNLHQDGGGQQLEEFTQALDYQVDATSGDVTISNFYDRTTPDLSFANREKDQWRPSEIVADAVTLLSNDFCDGSIEDGIATLGNANGDISSWLRGRYGCGTVKVTSYLNQNRPKIAISNNATKKRSVLWVRSNIADSFPEGVRPTTTGRNIDEGESPIFVARQGDLVQWNDESGTSTFYDKDFVQTKDDKKLMPAADNTRMNMIMVSGLVPSRAGQSYGGLHNFPRFLEDWDKKKLFISGAFLQLNFSNYATAPFDQEAWQIGAPAPKTGDTKDEQWIRYYKPPNRLWGYDVALQYAPAGPVAQRFQFAEDTRSEFYTEPPADDPYIRNLCLQVPGKTTATCP